MLDFAKSNRGIFSIIAVVGGILIAVALFMQYQMGLEPCNLCMFQRVFVIAAAVTAALAALHGCARDYLNTWVAKLYALIVIVFAGTGAFVAGRQLWLQSLPADQVPACGPDLEYMLDAYPFMEMITEVLQGSGGCATTQWVFMGLSIPGWTMLCFVAAILLALVVLLRRAA